MNAFENQPIKRKHLPAKWLETGVLEKFEEFLQWNWEQRSVFYEDGQITSRQQFINFNVRDGIKLNNYIGTICFKGETLNIFPKVYKLDAYDDDTTDWKPENLVRNLVSWLNYCNKIEYPFIRIDTGIENTSNLFELLVSVFVHYLKKTMESAPYRCYEDTYEESSVVKGKIDIKDYFTHKIPTGNWHRIGYTYSNFLFDNSVNRIIKSTCKILYNLTAVRKTKEVLRILLLKLGDVTDVRPMPYECDRIRLDHRHKHYAVIISMCKMFLLNMVNSNSVGVSNSYCFLFPAELLFEGFVGGYLKELFGDRAKIKCQASDQYLAKLYVDEEYKGRAFNLREDILIETDNTVIVLDTKYKELESFSHIRDDYSNKLGISDADMKQMAIYAIKRNAKRIFLLYPLYREEPLETKRISYKFILDEEYPAEEIILEVLRIPFVFDSAENDFTVKLNSVLNRILA